MRLACPNCDAKYEVPDDAVPEAGRDVQCSNCGHAWFQLRPEQELAVEEEAALYGDDLVAPQDDPAPEVDAAAALRAALAGNAGVATGGAPDAMAQPAGHPTSFPEDDLDDEPSAADGLDAPRDDAGTAAEPAAPAVGRAMDDAVLAVLREEAEREAEARRNEAQRADNRRAEAEGQMQTQPDLGVTAPAAGAALSPTQRRLAMLRGEDPDAPPAEPSRPAARRDLLPDVEELTSTLQPGEDPADADEAVDALPDLTRGRFSFRTGFLLMIFVALVAAVVYMAAPSISAAIPALEGPLAGYVAFVDGLRSWLNGAMDAATQAISGETPPQG